MPIFLMQARKKDNQKAFLVKKIADKHGVTTRFVYQVLAGDRENEAIFSDYMTAKEDTDKAIENIQNNGLMAAVLRVAPSF